MLLSDIPELQRYPHVSGFVKHHLSMQFGDVRAMLRLPLPGIEHGCNFAVATVLCSLVSGISESFFMPANPIQENCKGEKEWTGSGKAFRQLVRNFYPWEPDEKQKSKRKKADVLYYFLRNPLTHALGVEREDSYQIKISKNSLQNDQIEEIEKSPTRPDRLPPGLSWSGKQWTLDSRGFYRDAFHMFWNLTKDEQQMTDAEQRFSSGKIIWRYEDPCEFLAGAQQAGLQ